MPVASQFIVDESGRALLPLIGMAVPVPRAVNALGLAQGRLVAFPRLLVDPAGFPLGSPDGAVIGSPQVFVHRLASAAPWA
jgi:hypothetical protein